MSTDSDGSGIQQKQGGLSRHYSVGSISTQEINKIIGIDATKKINEIKTYIDKNKPKKGNGLDSENLGGLINKLKTTSNTNCMEIQNNDVFKPRNSVSRTPTKSDTCMNDSRVSQPVFTRSLFQTGDDIQKSESTSDLTSAKRLRSESSPDSMERTNCRRKLDENKENEIEKMELAINTESMLKRIIKALDVI